MTGPLHFVSVGMVVLDELRFPTRETLHDVVGGSAAYATFGARMVIGAADSKRVGMLVLAGDDFPATVREQFQEWEVRLQVQEVAGKKSTRGLLEYLDEDFGRKTFRYLTPPLQPKPEHLEACGLLRSSAFHILARPQDAIQHVEQLLTARERNGITEKPLIVWEPAPPFCKTENLDAHVRASREVDVFSPNHLELTSLFEESSKARSAETPFNRAVIEMYARKFLDASSKGSGNCTRIVVRAGEHGCFVVSNEAKSRWLPAFYEPSSSKIVDPTGAGNAFLGVFTVALQQGKDLVEAAVCGSVAASLALEQIGLPELRKEDRGEAESWNGEVFWERLRAFKERL